MTDIIGEYVEFIYCGCGCGKTTSKYIIRIDTLKPRPKRDLGEKKFLIGHHVRGKKGKDHPAFGIPKTKEWLELMSKKMSMENNSSWKGDEAGYGAKHERLRKLIPKPEFCVICKINPPRDISNKTGKYLYNDLDDWYWLCTSCHRLYDKANNIRRVS